MRALSGHKHGLHWSFVPDSEESLWSPAFGTHVAVLVVLELVCQHERRGPLGVQVVGYWKNFLIILEGFLTRNLTSMCQSLFPLLGLQWDPVVHVERYNVQRLVAAGSLSFAAALAAGGGDGPVAVASSIFYSCLVAPDLTFCLVCLLLSRKKKIVRERSHTLKEHLGRGSDQRKNRRWSCCPTSILPSWFPSSKSWMALRKNLERI